ncbi:MAG: FMN-binding negative transcriptional regulator [Pseudomonadota bacterium]
MYTPRAFREERPEILRAAIDRIALATLVTVGTQIGASQVPLILDKSEDGSDILVGHLARANNLWKDCDGRALAVFLGPHHYISPSWYPTKAQTQEVVPTWNYISVHAHGEIAFFDDESRLRDLLEQLVRRHEAGREVPWNINDAPADYIARQMRAIVGFTIRITSLEGQWKLSQNKGLADYNGVMEGLRKDGALDLLSIPYELEKAAKA